MHFKALINLTKRTSKKNIMMDLKGFPNSAKDQTPTNKKAKERMRLMLILIALETNTINNSQRKMTLVNLTSVGRLSNQTNKKPFPLIVYF
jgi:hypothetical protein